MYGFEIGGSRKEMEEWKTDILERRKELVLWKEEIKNGLEKAPEGELRLSCRNGKVRYYNRTNKEDTTGIYIPQKEIALAQALAQKDYNQKVLRNIEQAIRAIDKFLALLPQNGPEDIYETLHIERQKLIVPIRETDQQFRECWEQTFFQGKELAEDVPPLYTEKGERVRSKSEVIIADILYREGIPYRYEAPIILQGFGMVHPDFTVLNLRKRKEIYWEHLGMMDNTEYVEAALAKVQAYKKNGIEHGDNLILTWETKKTPIHQRAIRSEIEKYLR